GRPLDRRGIRPADRHRRGAYPAGAASAPAAADGLTLLQGRWWRLPRVQRDAVAFRVEHDGAVTVRADRVLRLEHGAARNRGGSDCGVEAAVRIQVEQWAAVRR